MAKPRPPGPRLSIEQATEIYREFLPAGDEIFRYMSRLQEAGFSAFLPRHRFIESFAATPKELAIHRRCTVEIAKERLVSFPPIVWKPEYLRLRYASPYLEDLRERRDTENGGGIDVLGARYSGGESAWRIEIDPCQRRLVQDRVTNRDDHQARFEAMRDEERRALQEEARRHASGIGKSPITFDRDSR